ncbi:MAG: L-2-amino-thiazoline-4-carboxylic acid hydrolase [Anaerolineales bacterium]|nr:L-2-amino-thiazoline-4-carboxylic acid hydrolase [Anaerolineales bacterium]
MEKIKERHFPLRLAAWLPACYTAYLHWLRHLLERLGRECALAAWQEAQQGCDESLLGVILGAGWQESDTAADVEQVLASLPGQIFPAEVEGISQAEARCLVEQIPPIPQIRRTFSSLNVWKEASAYEALHLRFDSLARLTEALIRRHGKQGELIAYDVLREERRRAAGGQTTSVAEFLAGLTTQPAEANLFTAGLEMEVLHADRHAVVMHVRQCEWARYFQERHPQVGYLMACSTDETAYRASNAAIRLRRTTTLMEGGEVCDFRIYARGAEE